MGIRGMTRLLVNYQKTQPYVKYRTKIIAIDVNILIYKFCHIYHNSMPLYLECFIYKICSFLKFGIFPVFIFDGDAPKEKQDIITKCVNTKRKYRAKLEELTKNVQEITPKTPVLLSAIKKLQRQSFMITKNHRDYLIQLLQCLNLPHFIAEGEAEMLCASLQKAGQVDYTLSDDTDTIAFGCTRTVRMFKNCERYLIETDINSFLASKYITHDEFLNACVLTGCDYMKKPSIIALDKCIDYVRRFHTLDRTLHELKKTRKMNSIEEYRHIKDMYEFKTACTFRIVKQQQEHGHIIHDKLIELETSSEHNEFCNVQQFLLANDINSLTIQNLIRLIQNSVNDFLLIRHNFFATRS